MAAATIIAASLQLFAVANGDDILDGGGWQLPHYPNSTFIAGCSMDVAAELATGVGGDTWPSTWAESGQHFAMGCDNNDAGEGQKSFMNWWTVDKVPTKSQHREETTVNNSVLNVSLVNNWPIPRAQVMEICHQYNNGTATGNSGGNIKPSSVIALGNLLFAGVQCMTYFDRGDAAFLGRQRAWNAWIVTSDDSGRSWNASATALDFFTGRLTNPMFIGAGKGQAAAPDGYIYVHFPAASEPDTAYWDGNDYILLGRVPMDQILVRSAYEFYTGLTPAGVATWKTSSASAAKVFEFKHMTGQDHTFYSPQLKRYILPNYGFMDPKTGLPAGWHGLYTLKKEPPASQLALLEAPHPWGPWSIFYLEQPWAVQGMPGGYCPDFPAAFASEDGLSLRMTSSACCSHTGYSYHSTAVELTLGGDDQRSNLKTDDNEGAMTASAPPAPARAACQPLPQTNCQQHDLRNAGPVASAAACCDLCHNENECSAWTWNRAEGNHGCWLKRSCAGKVHDPKADSGLVEGGPTPAPRPSPKAPRQVGVSLGGWMLMETAWMYDQFRAAAENDWVRELRKKGDAYALQTMQTHWSGYIPDAALDLMVTLGINHVRVPVGYWLVEAPVGGGTTGRTMRDPGFQHEGYATGGVTHVESLLAKLKVRGISALIDLHAMPGGASKCQSYAGWQVEQPYFWQGSTGNSSGMIQACPGAGPYSSSRPAGETWLSVGEAAAKSIAVWIVGLQKKRSLSRVVTGFEVVNEPGLGSTGMVDPIRRYHDNVVPAVQKIFKDASLAVSTTVNFIGPNDKGMGEWLKSRVATGAYSGGDALTVDFHDYYNWDGPLSFAQVRAKVCGTTATSAGLSQYINAGLQVVIGEW